jgi:integrase/recombinase XerD
MSSEEAVAAALKSVLDDLCSPGAKRAYDTDWNRFSEWIAGQKIDALKVTPKVVRAHVVWMRDERKLARATIGKAISVIREVYRAMVNEEVIAVNPARETKPPKMDGSLRTPVLTEEQVLQLLGAQPHQTWTDKRNLLVIKTLFGLGWRRAEVARMQGSDFDGVAVSAVVKGGKTISVAAPAWLRTELDEWRGESLGPVFPRSPGSEREISGNIIYDIVRKAAKRAGLARGSVTPHAMRRTFITLAGLKGVPLRARQLSVGHTSASTTERYDHARDARATAVGDVFADMVGQ